MNLELVQRAVKQAVGEVQWQQALHRLEKTGVVQYSTHDIPALVQEVQDDVSLSHGSRIKEFIYQAIKNDVMKEAVKGLADWYKKQLSCTSDDDIDIGTPAVA